MASRLWVFFAPARAMHRSRAELVRLSSVNGFWGCVGLPLRGAAVAQSKARRRGQEEIPKLLDVARKFCR